MLLNLFNEMRAAKVPVSVRELLDLHQALQKRVVFADMDAFYYLARAILVKDERHFDKFDRAFAAYFKGLENLDRHIEALIPEDWLRKFAREGAAEELDIDGTIDHTARDAGLLNIQMRPERRNTVKLLLLFDIGGSMDAHVKVCEELFSACKTEFKHLEYYYFHNIVYESVWKNNLRRTSERFSTFDLLHKYGDDYKVIFVGDAAMAPYEITQPGGSVEHWNEEAGYVWMQRFMEKFRKIIWINPYPKQAWDYTASTHLVRDLIEGQDVSADLAGAGRRDAVSVQIVVSLYRPYRWQASSHRYPTDFKTCGVTCGSRLAGDRARSVTANAADTPAAPARPHPAPPP